MKYLGRSEINMRYSRCCQLSGNNLEHKTDRCYCSDNLHSPENIEGILSLQHRNSPAKAHTFIRLCWEPWSQKCCCTTNNFQRHRIPSNHMDKPGKIHSLWTAEEDTGLHIGNLKVQSQQYTPCILSERSKESTQQDIYLLIDLMTKSVQKQLCTYLWRLKGFWNQLKSSWGTDLGCYRWDSRMDIECMKKYNCQHTFLKSIGCNTNCQDSSRNWQCSLCR